MLNFIVLIVIQGLQSQRAETVPNLVSEMFYLARKACLTWSVVIESICDYVLA